MNWIMIYEKAFRKEEAVIQKTYANPLPEERKCIALYFCRSGVLLFEVHSKHEGYFLAMVRFCSEGVFGKAAHFLLTGVL